MLGVGAVEIEPLDENETDAMNMESPRVQLIWMKVLPGCRSPIQVLEELSRQSIRKHLVKF
jgi:hypothetical protein